MDAPPPDPASRRDVPETCLLRLFIEQSREIMPLPRWRSAVDPIAIPCRAQFSGACAQRHIRHVPVAGALLARGRVRRFFFHLTAWMIPFFVLAGLITIAGAVHLSDHVAMFQDLSSEHQKR